MEGCPRMAAAAVRGAFHRWNGRDASVRVPVVADLAAQIPDLFEFLTAVFAVVHPGLRLSGLLGCPHRATNVSREALIAPRVARKGTLARLKHFFLPSILPVCGSSVVPLVLELGNFANGGHVQVVYLTR